MKVNEKLKAVLNEINFIHRYKNICQKYNNFSDTLENHSHVTIEKIFKDLNINITYNKKHGFYQILDILNNYKFQLNISLKYGLVELIFSIIDNSEVLGGTFDFMAEAIGESEKLELPGFRNYDDLKNILRENLNIYKDIKNKYVQN